MIGAFVLAALTATATVHHPVTTTDPQAQALFDRGLTLYYAFNGEAAERVFAQALKRDPHLAMAAWGEALADGPDLNTDLDAAHFAQAQSAVRTAQSLEAYASPNERAYIDAMATRYAGTYANAQADDDAYRQAMERLVSTYPLDDDAAMLDAEALLEVQATNRMWNRDGTPSGPYGARILQLVQTVLQRNPAHLMANHLCIHADDYAPDRRAALACAARLAADDFEPAAEHLAHMPAHTYIETGAYADAIAADDRAWRLRQAWNAVPNAPTLKYAAHDAYSGWSSALMLGNLAIAQTWAARAGSAFKGDDTWVTLARFGEWERILQAPDDSAQFYAPLSKGLAAAHLGNLNEARAMLALYGNTDTDYRWLLEAAVDEREAHIPDAIAALQRALAYQQREDQAETLPLFPADEALGALYYRQERFADARDAFKAALERYPNDPRALYGLARSLQQLGQAVSSNDALKTFNQIWNVSTLPNLADL